MRGLEPRKLAQVLEYIRSLLFYNDSLFDILAKGKTDYHCKIKETLYIQELEPAFNVNVGSEKLMLY